MQKTTSPRLIANTLPPPRRDDAPVLRRALDPATPDPRATRMTAQTSDRYRIADRTLDHVVDRLLEELTW